MRDNVKFFVKTCSRVFDPPEPILEIGSLQVPGQVGYADLRPFFAGKNYIGCDMRPGIGVDRIENVEKLSLRSETVGTVIIVDTLEHVENPHKALDEIFRVLKMDGIVTMTSVQNFIIHDVPGDFWRFTPEAFNLLLKDFPVRIIGSQGALLNPHTVFGVGFKHDAEIATKFHELCRSFSEELRRIPKRKRIRFLRTMTSPLFIKNKVPYFIKVKLFEELAFNYYALQQPVESFKVEL